MSDIETIFRMLWDHEYRRLSSRVQRDVKKILNTCEYMNLFHYHYYYRTAYISAYRFHRRMSKIYIILENMYNHTYNISDVIHMNTNKYHFIYKFGRI